MVPTTEQIQRMNLITAVIRIRENVWAQDEGPTWDHSMQSLGSDI